MPISVGSVVWLTHLSDKQEITGSNPVRHILKLFIGEIMTENNPYETAYNIRETIKELQKTSQKIDERCKILEDEYKVVIESGKKTQHHTIGKYSVHTKKIVNSKRSINITSLIEQETALIKKIGKVPFDLVNKYITDEESEKIMNDIRFNKEYKVTLTSLYKYAPKYKIDSKYTIKNEIITYLDTIIKS